jgi:cobalt/nickel transport system ATP-binding protein
MEIAIKVTDLSFVYPDGTIGLNKVSFEIRKGQTVVIVGANGTGKSTLLLNLMGISRGEGEIEIFGVPMNKKSLSEVCGRLGLVFQNPDDQLFCPTVFDDVAFGPINLGYGEETVRQKVKKALSSVRMERFYERSSHHLSFGEKKKVSLASVLSMDPEILLLDEPTGGLDPRSASELLEILHHLKEEGKTILTTTHDLYFVSELADIVFVMGESKNIVAKDLPHIIFSNRKLLLENNLIHQSRSLYEHPKEKYNVYP